MTNKQRAAGTLSAFAPLTQTEILWSMKSDCQIVESNLAVDYRKGGVEVMVRGKTDEKENDGRVSFGDSDEGLLPERRSRQRDKIHH